MFYSESLQSPIGKSSVKRMYGVNPDNDPARALAIGIYPLTEAPAGYTALAYTKEGNSYTTVSSTVTTEEQEMINVVRSVSASLSTLRTSLGLPATQEVPQAIDGYYPLYTSEAQSDALSSDGTSHTHVLDGVTYYMPNAGVTLYHGDYTG